jgi:hypothetical protein
MTDRKTALADSLSRLAPQQRDQAAAVTAMPAEQATPAKFDERISMTLPADMKHELTQAREADKVELTTRLRAMIMLWQSDPKHRARVDKLAKSLRRDRSTYLPNR